jgi:anti-sigma regulatory factor (Ser/Thr protein kinase)/RimJ/RimL family protein N-acetyltransferase
MNFEDEMMDAKFQISADDLMIGPVCDFTNSWALNCGLTKGDALRFTVAVSELITDIVLFAYPENSRDTLEIEFRHTFSNAEIYVCELGEPFDPDRHIYSAEKALKGGSFEGAGFKIMRSFCDDFSFFNEGKAGKKFWLSKYIQIHEIDELLRQPADQRKTTYNRDTENYPAIKIDEFTVERIMASDAEDISKLFYRTYGYSYKKEEVYLPKKIETMVLGKVKLGVIAREEEGKAIGYFGVIPAEDSAIAEVGEAIVSPAYRRNGVMSAMLKRLIEIVKSQQFTALYGEAVTFHIISQKVNNKIGFKSSALMLATSSGVQYKGFNKEYPQEVSIILDYLPLVNPPEKSVFVPEKYKEMIFKTYNHLGFKVDFVKPNSSDVPAKKNTELKIHHSKSTNLITIKEYGPDFPDVLSDVLKTLEERNPNTIFLDLPLENSATPGWFSTSDSYGFIYAGLAPQFHNEADYLRLQKVYKKLDFGLIEIYSDFGKQIKSYVENEYNKHI